VGGLGGTAAEHAIKDTTGYEYIVRKANGDLLSVTQKDETPLAVGQHVLVIAGPQARIVARLHRADRGAATASIGQRGCCSQRTPDRRIATVVAVHLDRLGPAGRRRCWYRTRHRNNRRVAVDPGNLQRFSATIEKGDRSDC
jgi:hypothetical protein